MKKKKTLLKILKRSCIIILYIVALFVAQASHVFAADEPLTVINNLSDFIFGLIRAVGMIILGFGVVQVGMSLKSHDPSQRANGFMTLSRRSSYYFRKGNPKYYNRWLKSKRSRLLGKNNLLLNNFKEVIL